MEDFVTSVQHIVCQVWKVRLQQHNIAVDNSLKLPDALKVGFHICWVMVLLSFAVVLKLLALLLCCCSLCILIANTGGRPCQSKKQRAQCPVGQARQNAYGIATRRSKSCRQGMYLWLTVAK